MYKCIGEENFLETISEKVYQNHIAISEMLKKKHLQPVYVYSVYVCYCMHILHAA